MPKDCDSKKILGGDVNWWHERGLAHARRFSFRGLKDDANLQVTVVLQVNFSETVQSRKSCRDKVCTSNVVQRS